MFFESSDNFKWIVWIMVMAGGIQCLSSSAVEFSSTHSAVLH